MRIVFKPIDQNVWEDFFLEQFLQTGHGMPVFQGTKYQRGSGLGSIFGGLFRSLLPVVKSVGKAVGKQAIHAGLNVASDALSGRNVGEAVQEHSRVGAAHLLDQAKDHINTGPKRRKRKNQKGRGIGQRPGQASTKALRKTKPVIRKTKRREDQLGVYYTP